MTRSYLLPLTYDKPVVEKIYLKDVTGKVRGSLFVKIYWDGIEVPEKEMHEFNRVSYSLLRLGKIVLIRES